jgi:hypothetical protein
MRTRVHARVHVYTPFPQSDQYLGEVDEKGTEDCAPVEVGLDACDCGGRGDTTESSEASACARERTYGAEAGSGATLQRKA